MRQFTPRHRPGGRCWLAHFATFIACSQLLSGCYVINFFKRDKSSGEDAPPNAIIGQYTSQTAGGADAAALAQLYSITSSHAPAAIRPDPDLYIRRLLRQYRPEGAIIARQIGRIEPYRELLGGATADFNKPAQDSYDATSLLAVLKVAEEVCRGLVAPNTSEHGDWQTILPYPAASEERNVEWLAQRFTGKLLAKITSAQVEQLLDIMKSEEPTIAEQWWARDNAYAKYIPACATLALDAEALYL